MRANVLEQFLVLPRQRQLDPRAGPQLADARDLVEMERLLIAHPLQEIFHIRYWRRREHLGHVRVDELLAALARHGDAVVAVLDEIGVADLVQLDRR